MKRNPQALAMAFKKFRGKLLKIKELGVHPEMTQDDIDSMTKLLAVSKADKEGGDWKDFVEGQSWYVEGLVEFSGMTTEEQLEHEYQDCFADTASETEMLESLKSLAA